MKKLTVKNWTAEFKSHKRIYVYNKDLTKEGTISYYVIAGDVVVFTDGAGALPKYMREAIKKEIVK